MNAPGQSRARMQRKALLARSAGAWGLDFVEAIGSTAAACLRLHFVPPAAALVDAVAVPPDLAPSNLRVVLVAPSGEHRLVVVESLLPPGPRWPNAVDAFLALDGAALAGDAHVTVTLVDLPGVDPQFARADLTFPPHLGVAEAGAAGSDAAAVGLPGAYLARDAEGLLRLAQERLRVVSPRWRERSPADAGVMLVELMSHVADALSYQQDAVAAEAYLATARRRSSLRRHARLLDYPIDDGTNARVWIQITVARDVELARGTPFATRGAAAAQPIGAGPQQFPPRAVFESLHTARLHVAHNVLPFHDWGAHRWVIEAGSTEATLDGHFPALARGDVLVLMQRREAAPGAPDASPSRRAAVRLSRAAVIAHDPVSGRAITRVWWHRGDALPFPIVVGTSDGEPLAVALGNVVLADHGATIVAPVDVIVPREARAAITLAAGGSVAVGVPYDHDAASELPAAYAMRQDAREALPFVTVEERRADRTIEWHARRDLFSSGRFDRDFIAELDGNETVRLRFGDGLLGRAVVAGTTLRVRWRLGGGPDGGVAHESIVETYGPGTDDIEAVSNPLPAVGGTEGERAAVLRRDAPTAFRRQDRCVAAEDFVAAARSVDRVVDAAVQFAWTGSWHVVLLHVRTRDDGPLDDELRVAVQAHVQRRTLAGLIVDVRDPRWVAVAVELRVRVRVGALAAASRRIAERLAAPDLGHGRPRGYVRGDSYGFGESVYLAPIIAAVSSVPDVHSVEATRFERVGEPRTNALSSGALAIGPTEIAVLRGTARASAKGYLELDVEETR